MKKQPINLQINLNFLFSKIGRFVYPSKKIFFRYDLLKDQRELIMKQTFSYVINGHFAFFFNKSLFNTN